MTGLKRHLAEKIRFLLQRFPAVILLGARQCGKTCLSQAVLPDWKYFDLENSKDRDFIARDFDFFFREYPDRLILDEAQEAPELFKNLRGVIDGNRKQNGRFLITGSASPDLIAQASDSLAGRAALTELGTFKVSETRKQPLSPFFDIFSAPLNKSSFDFLKTGFAKLQPFDILPFMLKGGYPDPCLSEEESYFGSWMKSYFDSYINRDIRKLYPRLDSVRFQRFVSMLSSLSGAIVNRAEAGRSLDLNEVSVKHYLDIAEKTFLWRQIPAFSSSAKKALVKMPKGFLRDTGLIHYLLDIKTREQLLRSPKAGQIFEAFVMEEILKGLSCSLSSHRYRCSYYRTRSGAEVDFILEGDFGLLPVEIKFSASVRNRGLTALRRFIKEYKAPFGLVVNCSDKAQALSDNIMQIPAAFL